MEAEELRIGNWINHPENYAIEVNSTTIDLMSILKNNRFNPIPLTEEVLLNSGFEKIESRQDYFELSSYDPYNPTPEGCRINVFFDFDGVRLWYAFESDGARLIRRIHYVHQLQNLYFALTGEELEIDLNK